MKNIRILSAKVYSFLMKLIMSLNPPVTEGALPSTRELFKTQKRNYKNLSKLKE
jgi:hypothetical protein